MRQAQAGSKRPFGCKIEGIKQQETKGRWPLPLGRVLGLELSMGGSAPPALFLLAGVFFAIGLLIFHASLVVAIFGALGLTAFHVSLEVVHQWGHWMAARSVGHPMTGVRLWLIYGVSEYPYDEGELPSSVHIRRALGGPMVSFVVSLALAPIAWYVWAGDDLLPAGWLAIAAFADSLMFSVGALIPLGFNDASSILSALRSR